MSINYLKMTVSSVEESKDVVCAAIVTFVEPYIKIEEQLSDLQACVAEIMDNCITFAYPNSVGAISVSCKILKNNVLSIAIKDKGVGIENVEQAMKDLFSTCGKNHSGLGFTIIKAFMEDVKVLSLPGKGTTVNMKKHIDLD